MDNKSNKYANKHWKLGWKMFNYLLLNGISNFGVEIISLSLDTTETNLKQREQSPVFIEL